MRRNVTLERIAVRSPNLVETLPREMERVENFHG